MKKTQYQYCKFVVSGKKSQYCFILIILLTILVICSICLSCHTVVIPTLSCWWTLWRLSLDQRKIVTAFPVTRPPPPQQLCLVLFFYRLKHIQRVKISNFWLTILTLMAQIKLKSFWEIHLKPRLLSSTTFTFFPLTTSRRIKKTKYNE